VERALLRIQKEMVKMQQKSQVSWKTRNYAMTSASG
jgi:hypothetical protein